PFEFAKWIWTDHVRKSNDYSTAYVTQIINRTVPRLVLPLLHEHYFDYHRMSEWSNIVKSSQIISQADKYNEMCLDLQDWRFEQYATIDLIQTLIQLPNNLQIYSGKIRFPPTLFLISNAV